MPLRTSWRKTKRWFVHLLRLDESAHRIALGAAVGMFIALTPTVGLQMLLVFLVTSVIPGNRAAGLPLVWITNPATIVPIYSFNYTIGRLVTAGPTLHEFEQQVVRLLADDPTWWAFVKGWWDIVMEVAAPLWIGSLAVGLVAGGAAYGLMYGLIRFYRRHYWRHFAALRRARRAARGKRRRAKADRAEAAAGPGSPPTENE